VASGDPGLFGPESISWRIDREVMVLAGGTCALLLQLAHPAVAAGVAQHSDFRANPFARLRRTLHATFDIVFGTTPQAERSLARIDAIHGQVRGRVPESGVGYRARDPRLLLWVHATLVDTALRITDRFIRPLSEVEAEAYHAECRQIAVMFGVPEPNVPRTLVELRAWMASVIASGEVAVSNTARSLAPAVLYPTRALPCTAWDLAHLASISVMPAELRRGYGLAWTPRHERGARLMAAGSRRILPLLPAMLLHVPHARSADHRINAGAA
jgi:uncharacterized protein (DUF2236 family)